ncbi:ferritin-like domain-containing protein [Halomarina litorea]|uniref:ferritin-like domain-containing protein n=1 Tax=Halomarina litorea TaxID=2961595 RepID=UPI0020C1D08F|nr:ferritin-like domain-containing protein [Halomarina sp. BCD28]
MDDTNGPTGHELVQNIVGDASDLLTDRRSFMSSAAKLGVGGALLSFAGSGGAAAEDHAGEVSDVDILNYALTLEELEAHYYAEALETFDELEDIENEGTVGGEVFQDLSVQHSTYQFLEQIGMHEREHADALRATIEKVGGTPADIPEFTFPYQTPEEFVALAHTIENVGVSAYAGAAPMIQNEEILKAALSIHSVEARHAAYLGVLNQRAPWSGAFDPARSMEQVLAIASQFIEN